LHEFWRYCAAAAGGAANGADGLAHQPLVDIGAHGLQCSG
jgi:hypothetical protein